MIKKLITKVISKERITKIVRSIRFYRNYTDFFQNYWTDMLLFYKYSSIYKIDSYQKKEAKIVLHYHSLEKGLIHSQLKYRFAKDKIVELHKLLKDVEIQQKMSNSQIQVAFKILKQYYEIHQKSDSVIADYFTQEQYNEYCSKILVTSENFTGAIEYSYDNLYHNNQDNYFQFSYSRKSVRNFNGELIPQSIISEAIQLSLNSPSVCNRQASKVYLIEDQDKIQKILKIQGGFSGFSSNVKQLLIVTNDRSYFYTLGERNQFYIDGGIYLMNLLYALHYYKIANCPANWGKKVSAEKELDKIIEIPKCEKIICLVPIGIAAETFKIPLSQRRSLAEVFYKL